MRLWKKAMGALKDRYNIWVAKLSPYGPCKNPNLQTVIIKATSHDEEYMDYKNVQKVFQWLRTSPLYLKPLLSTLSMRMERTHSWVVALKGLMLLHGVFCFDLTMVQRMGRLPFDLSHFSDGHINPEKACVFNTFIRSYFAYLDQRSTFVQLEAKKQKKNSKEIEESLMEELRNLEKLQVLIDLLLQIKPSSTQNMNVVLILEAMDSVKDELVEVYGKFCKGVNHVLTRVCDIGGKEEACVGLDVARKAEVQGDKLSLYFEFCRDIGVLNTSECPKIARIPQKDIEELHRIMNGVSTKKSLKGVVGNEGKAILVGDSSSVTATVSEQKQLENGLTTTVITDQWEVFDDDIIVDVKQNASNATSVIATTNPFIVESYSLVPYNLIYNNVNLPDLISL